MKSLHKQQSELADPIYQLKVLQKHEVDIPRFEDTLATSGVGPIRGRAPRVLQINMGYMCNQTCKHCHVDAGPDRKEKISRALLERCLEILESSEISTIDLTGGAPEMHPDFRWFVVEAKKRGVHIMDRCNLTIVVANKHYRTLPAFFAEHEVELVSSLPHFSARRTDRQRGDGVFEQSIEALQLLNAVGYGMDDRLKLNLVYNPVGAFLPDGQKELEDVYKKKLKANYGIEFNELYAITNMPISRFLEYLMDTGNLEEYMSTLHQSFNPQAVAGLMCHDTLSIDYLGNIYDCDFNQMLDLKSDVAHPNIMDFDAKSLTGRAIITDQHCYGCTAGAGSSCGGETV